MTDHTKLIERIRKLLALSKSPNEHEALLAAKKANELMQEHQLSMSEVEINEELAQGIVEELYSMPGLKMKYNWVQILAIAAAKLFDGEALCTNDLHGTTVIFVGNPSDTQAMKEMWVYFFQSWSGFVENDLRRTKNQAKMNGNPWQPKDTMKFKQGHGTGFAHRVYTRVMALVQARHTEMKQKSTSRSLVVVKDQMISKHLEEIGVQPKTLKGRIGSDAGRALGHQAGDQVALGGAIEEN